MSLAELAMSLTVMTMIAGMIGMMALGVQSAARYTRGQGDAVQHARVVLDRIDRALQGATVSESFPGFTVLTWTDGSGTFPDTLVIWKPSGTAVDPTGVPRANELLIVRPDPNNSNVLLEITNPNESATVTYAASSASNWRSLVTTLTTRSNAVKVPLTDMLRTAATSTSTTPTIRGAVRFRYSAAPTDTELANYRSGQATWTSLAWPLDLDGSSSGIRSLACFVELQLAPQAGISSGDNVLPFFGSTTLNKEVLR